MYRNIDVKTEVRKLTGSKPVHAVAGAGVLASQTLKDLPGLLVRWRTENPVSSLPTRATGYAHKAQSRATGYVHKARAMATDGYDQLAARGRKAMNGQRPTTGAKSIPAAPSKTAANGKTKGKTPSRPSGTTGASN
jgi:hypothetical protein